MFSRQEASLLRTQFWTAFGQYMKPVPPFEGDKVNWLNYKTGLKDVSFKLNADQKKATIAIEIIHGDPGIRQFYFEQFKQLKAMFENRVGEKWVWRLHDTDENGRMISRIFTHLDDVSIFNKGDWPRLISFFKPRIIAMDEFWSSARYSFEALH